MGPDADDDDDVATATTLAAQLDPGPVVGAGRDRQLQALAVDLDPAAGSAERLLEADLRRGFRGRRGGTRPPCGRATGVGRVVQAHLAEDVIERRARPPAPTGARGAGRACGFVGGEERPEEVREVAARAAATRPELVAHIARLASSASEAGERVASCRGAVGTGSGLAVRLPVGAKEVVLAPLLGIGEDRMGLVDVLEASLGDRVSRALVRMVLPGELAERLLDLGLARASSQAEGLVVVLVIHRAVESASPRRDRLARGPAVLLLPSPRGRRPAAARPAGTSSVGPDPRAPAPDRAACRRRRPWPAR